MKIGTLTFHQSTNYGGVLQAYALQQAISKMGAECEIIDYRCEPIWQGNFPLKGLPQKRLREIPAVLLKSIPQAIKNRNFDRFKNKHMVISKKSYSREEVSELEQAYDRFVVGSDQVWKLELTGRDLTYYLDFCSDKKKFSYAASFGSDCVEGEQKEVCSKYLSRFSGLSAREEASAKTLEGIVNKKVNWVVDPVFLLSKNDWEKLITHRKINGAYIFVFRLHDKNVYDYAMKLSEKTGLPVISLEVYLKGMKSAKQDHFAKVEDFLNYIYYADHVVTDSFHCTAFSLLFERNVHPVLQGSKKAMNGRLVSLMRLIEHEYCIVDMQKEVRYETEINYENANSLLTSAINASRDYVANIILGRKIDEN